MKASRVADLTRVLIGRGADLELAERRRALLVAWIAVLLASASVVVAVYCFVFVGAGTIGCLTGAAVYVGSLLLVRGGHHRAGAALLCTNLLLGLIGTAAFIAGPEAMMSPVLVLVPMVATYVIGRKAGAIFGVVSAAAATAVTLLDRQQMLHVMEQSVREYGQRNLVPALVSAAMVVAIAFFYERSLAADLEQRLKLEEELGNARRLEAIGKLVAVMAHEVNNPLSSVAGNLGYVVDELPRDGRDDAEIQQALADAVGGVERIGRIVAGLKVFSRGDPVDPQEWVDLDEAISVAAQLAHHQLRPATAFERYLDEGIEVLGARAKLGQLFLNLMLNAVEASKPGHERDHRITVRSKLESGGAVVEVSDDGRGIRDEDLQRIFEPFFTTKPIGKGIGLGLSVCQGIVKSVGGSIEVESKVGAGTTFRLRFPRARRGQSCAKGHRTRTDSPPMP